MRTAIVFSSLVLLIPPAAGAAPLNVVVDFANSKGVQAGASVRSEGREIGEVRKVGFGEKNTVEVGLRIDEEHRERVRTASTFVIHEESKAETAWVEHVVIDPASPPAKNGERFEGSRSLVEAYLRRGRITSEELSRAMSKGLDQFRRDLKELQDSAEWAKLKDQAAKLAAELTVTGSEMARLLNEQLPKLQRELDQLYRRYEDELARRRQEQR